MSLMARNFFQNLHGEILLCSCLALLLSCSRPASQPNIIFIMSDDHAAHAISSYGSEINSTPNLDRLAAEGIRFENAFCTNSICAPSRAVILTGKYSHLNGVIDNRARFDSTQQTFPKLLQSAGYQTAMIGKWHLKSEPTGFDYWNVLPGQGAYYNPDFIEMGERKQMHGYVTDIITDLCLQWLEQRDKNRPFFLMYHHKAPHRNWMPGPDHLTMYDSTEIAEPPTLFDDYQTRSQAAREQEMTIAKHLYDDFDLKVTPSGHGDDFIHRLWQSAYDRMDGEQKRQWDEAYHPKNETFHQANLEGDDLVRWKYQRYLKDYLRTVAAIDDNLGRLLDYLDQNDLSQNTIVVYTSDQGFFLGDHGWYDKRFMYEESLRMPLIVRYPEEIEAGTSAGELVMNLDYAPTILDLAGVAVPDDMQGSSLRGIMRGESPDDWRSAIYYHYYEYPAWHMVKKHYGVRTQRYKLIHFYDDIDAWELYDLESDPLELKNVFHDSAYAAIVTELKLEIDRLRKQYKLEPLPAGN